MWLDPVFDRVAELAGSPVSQIKLIGVLLVSFPLASIYSRIPRTSPNLAHIYSLVVSMIYLVPILGLGSGLLHLLVSCLGTYLITILVRGPTMPWVAFVFCMSHLMYNHIRRVMLQIPTTEIEISFTQMVLVMNLTTFAWNVHDGRQRPEVLDDSQRATRLTKIPNPLAFFAYCFFFPAMLIGPAFDYSSYDALVTHTLQQSSSGQGGVKHMPRGRKRAAYLHLLIGVLFLAVYAVCGSQASYERVLSPVWERWSGLQKFGFIQFAGITARTKYYAVWSMTEGACILTRLGFNGYDPKSDRTRWNRIKNINIVSIETAQSFKILFDNWNIRTNVWLRDCVYKRLTKPGHKPGTMQSMATFVTSALWHGIEPGYYLAFITAGLLTSLGRQFRHFVRPYFLSTSPGQTTLAKTAYDLIGWFMVQTNLNYVAASFMLLSFKDCMRAWSRMGWYSHIIITICVTFFQFGGRSRLRRGLKGKEVAKSNPAPPRVRVSPPSPSDETMDDMDENSMRWLREALDDQAPPGVHPDGGFVDSVMRGAETPGNETPASPHTPLMEPTRMKGD